MENKERDRFLKIANLMHDDNDAVALQALRRCTKILVDNDKMWSHVITLGSQKDYLDFSDVFNKYANKNAYSTQRQPERPQARPRRPERPRRQPNISGIDMPTYIDGYITILTRYDGSKKNKVSFIDISVTEIVDDVRTVYSPIRIFDNVSMERIDDLEDSVISVQEYSLKMSNKVKAPYPRTGKIV